MIDFHSKQRSTMTGERPEPVTQQIYATVSVPYGVNNLQRLSKLLKEEVLVLLYIWTCLLYTSPSPRDLSTSRMPSSA